MKCKLMILGHGRSGKDHAANYLSKNYGLTFCGSSIKAAEIFLFDLLKDKYGYKTFEECFEDRHSEGMRKVWYDSIVEFNTPDKTKLAKLIYEQSDCYIGIRSYEELEQLKSEMPNLITVWISASGRIEAEPLDSCTVKIEQADYSIDNSSTVAMFEKNLDMFANHIMLTRQ